MAAGHQQKRFLPSSAVAGSSPVEHQHRGKKRKKTKCKSQLPGQVWSLRPHVALEWDDATKSAVARKDQVGIAWRDLSPFLGDLPPQQPRSSGLADVVSVPESLFGLEDLSDVLSYEVWERCLSESERKYLTQFLPEGSNAEDVVHSLLGGDNFHFGNPFGKWSSSLSSGHLHPDLILKHKKDIKNMKKNYYSELRKYHKQIIDSVLEWKDRWTNCKNPEKEIVEKIWRKGATATSPTSSDTIRTSRRKMTPESSFTFEDDTKYMSYFKVSKKQHQLIKKENYSGDGILSKTLNRVLGDIETFNLLPYVKFEEEERRNQHEYWLRLAYNDIPVAYAHFREQGALSRQWRNDITHELSEIEDVKNYSSASKDEKTDDSTTKHNNAVQYLSDEDLHQNRSGYDLHDEKCNLERIPSLNTHQDFEVEVVDHSRNQDKSTMIDSSLDTLQLNDETKDILKLSFSGENDRAACHLPENLHKENISNLHIEGDHLERIPSLNSRHEVEIMDMDHVMNQNSAAPPVNSSLDHLRLVEAINLAKNNSDEGTAISNTVNLRRLPSLNSHQDMETLALVKDESKDMDYTESQSSVGPLFFGNIKDADLVNTEGSDCSARELWTEESIMNSYCGSASQRSHMYNTGDGLSQKQPQTVPQIISMETDPLVGPTSDSMTSLASESAAPFFNQFANQQHGMLLPTFPKEQAMLPAYSNEHLENLKRSELPFLARNGLPHSSSTSHHFQGREMMLEHSHTREKEQFLHLMANNNQYPNLSQAPSGGAQDWCSYSSSTNGGLTGQDMFSTELLHSHNSWSGVGPSGTMNHCLGNERSTDGSLYSVVPEYNKGVPGYTCNNTLSHLTHGSNYLGNEIYNNGNVPSNSFPYRMIPGQLSNLNSREVANSTAAPLKAGGLPWMSYSHQNSSINDLIGKSYLRSWNQ